MSALLDEKKIDGVPQFVTLFRPVMDALRVHDGQASPQEVYDHIRQNYAMSDAFLKRTNSNGRSTFENRVGWAKFYLAKTGYVDSPRRRVWRLTDAGQTVEITDDQAADIFHEAKCAFRTESQASSIREDNPPISYWFAGATWSGEDQLDRFIREGVWENGYDDKFISEVRSMEPGDRIAVKSSFTRRYNLPFDYRGQTASVMGIKATGTITANHDDGRTVQVDWDPPFPRRDWYFYTFRTTLIRARVEDEPMAAELVDFAFNGKPQNYDAYLNRSYWVDRLAEVQPTVPLAEDENEGDESEDIEDQTQTTYSAAHIVDDGCFLPLEDIEGALDRLRTKKNLILQGPPGTGKTWLAKRLAKALIGSAEPTPDQLRVVQFHPSLSYEDFVRGYRPTAKGELRITDGVLLQIVEAARSFPDTTHVLVIEEINRGNPAKIFGEMLTLLESTKRSRSDAMELAYRKTLDERVFVPDNLHIVGTMNVADRSLALVDLALRRRFAFLNLEPAFNDAWAAWCGSSGLEAADIDRIRARVTALNAEIAEDRTLGKAFEIGHSYVTPAASETIADDAQWFADIIETELRPLLDEHWHDEPSRVEDLVAALRAGP